MWIEVIFPFISQNFLFLFAWSHDLDYDRISETLDFVSHVLDQLLFEEMVCLWKFCVECMLVSM